MPVGGKTFLQEGYRQTGNSYWLRRRTSSLYLDLDSLRRAFEQVTTLCIEVLWTQPLVVKSGEQTRAFTALLLLATTFLGDNSARYKQYSRTGNAQL